MKTTTIAYSMYAGELRRSVRRWTGIWEYEIVRLHPSDDEYWTAIEWLTERGLM